MTTAYLDVILTTRVSSLVICRRSSLSRRLEHQLSSAKRLSWVVVGFPTWLLWTELFDWKAQEERDTNQWWIQDFPEVGAPTQGAPTYDFSKFPQKLHEIERIWILREARIQTFTM